MNDARSGSLAAQAASESTGALPSVALRFQIAPASFSLPTPVQREVAVFSGGRIYLAGGLDDAGRSAAGVFSLDPATGTLASLGSMPQAFHDAAGAVIGGKLFVFGGGSSSSLDTVQAFDFGSNQGSVAGHLPLALSDLAAATAGRTTYLVGGYDGTSPQRTILATIDGTTFMRAGSLPVGLRYPAVAATPSGDVLIVGGETTSGPVSDVLLFSPTTGRVTNMGHLPYRVGHAEAFALGGLVYVVGGRDAGDRAVAAVSVIDPSRRTARPGAPLGSPVADAAAAGDGTHVWLIGGWRGSNTGQVLEAALVPKPATSAPGPTATGSGASAEAAGVRPFAGLLVVADRGNNRLLVMNADKHVLWTYPGPGMPAPPFRFYFPDDAFWVHGGHAILVNLEESHALVEIAYPSGKVLWSYGHPGVAGAAAGYLHQPDDLYPYPGGGMVVADALNCRILFFDADGQPFQQIGTTGVCTPGMPKTVGYPNGDTPLPDGDILVSELRGGAIDEVTPAGRIVWSVHVPGVAVPSDPQRLADGSYLTVDYERPGRVVRFDRAGKVLWSWGPTSGQVLDHPSLAAPLPNGLVAVNDDFADRVILLDPATNRIVWTYGRYEQGGTGAGFVHVPDGLDLLLPDGSTPLHVDFPSTATTPGRP
jgi:outer membrane protein assembly factor BamB